RHHDSIVLDRRLGRVEHAILAGDGEPDQVAALGYEPAAEVVKGEGRGAGVELRLLVDRPQILDLLAVGKSPSIQGQPLPDGLLLWRVDVRLVPDVGDHGEADLR